MSSPAALRGVRVLDLTRLLPGGFATMTLADLGADVVKVEQPGVGDGARRAPPYASDGQGALHLLLGRGKRSVCCDFAVEEGRRMFLDLVRGADVVVDSFRPGVLDRLGLGHEVLEAARPGLVQVSITGYGPGDARAGHDIDYVAVAGLLSMSGAPADPAAPGTQVADMAGALWAVIAVLSGLHERDRTGLGQVCAVSLTDSALSTTAIPAAALAVDGRVPTASAEWFNGGLAAYDVYRCADGGHVAVGALEPKFFAALCAALEVPELVELHLDPARQEEVRERLAAVFATRSRDAWAGELRDSDACLAPVLDLAEAMKASPAVSDRTLGDGSVMAQVGLPFAPNGATDPAAARPAPQLGEHTAELLIELGYDDEQVAALRRAGVV
jgi:crotonobetainyl-CoA:carnitine CoA-transferase CaiB-like acyl-CoA transferase